MVELVDTLVLGTSEAVIKVANKIKTLEQLTLESIHSTDTILTLHIKKGVKSGDNLQREYWLDGKDQTERITTNSEEVSIKDRCI